MTSAHPELLFIRVLKQVARCHEALWTPYIILTHFWLLVVDSEELLTKQAEMVLAADPGVPGEQPRVWVYRNTIKALNWYLCVENES